MVINGDEPKSKTVDKFHKLLQAQFLENIVNACCQPTTCWWISLNACIAYQRNSSLHESSEMSRCDVLKIEPWVRLFAVDQYFCSGIEKSSLRLCGDLGWAFLMWFVSQVCGSDEVAGRNFVLNCGLALAGGHQQTACLAWLRHNCDMFCCWDSVTRFEALFDRGLEYLHPLDLNRL